MMRKLLIATTLICAAMSLPAFAELKIGTVRTGDLAEKAPQFKTLQDKLKNEFERRQNDIEAEAKKLQDDGRAFQRDADTLTAADRATKEKSLTTRRIDIESKGRQLQEDFGKRRQELFAQTMGGIKTVIDNVAKERGLDLIVENPLFVKPELDVTAEVLKRLSTPGAK